MSSFDLNSILKINNRSYFNNNGLSLCFQKMFKGKLRIDKNRFKLFLTRTFIKATNLFVRKKGRPS